MPCAPRRRGDRREALEALGDRAVDVAAGEASDAAAKIAISLAMRRERRLVALHVRHQHRIGHARRVRSIRAITAAVLAICGTHLGETKLPASMVLQAGIGEPSISAILAATGTARASFCSPSRGADLDQPDVLRQAHRLILPSAAAKAMSAAPSSTSIARRVIAPRRPRRRPAR